MDMESMKQKAAGLLITLVNPRFAYFNRPFCLAITVAVLAFLGFWPLFGYYAWTTTTVVSDNSQADMTVISGPMMELDTVIMEYSRLPPRCTSRDGYHYFTGSREETSEDGLTTTERTCDYDVCILSTYEYTVEEREDTVNGMYDPSTGFYSFTWMPSTKMCMIQDEWLQGLVRKNNPFLMILNQSGANFVCDLGWKGEWCPFERELEAYQFVADCCEALKTLGPNQQLSGNCQVFDFETTNWQTGVKSKASDLYCSPMILHWIDYLKALHNKTDTAFYKICPEEDWRYSNSYFRGNMPNCTMTGSWALEPLSFKMLWTRNETVTTRTRSPLQDALAKAFALRSQIEIAVTLLIIVLFRQLGIVKETKEFTWGEIMAEEQSNKSLETEMQERMEKIEANILATLASKAPNGNEDRSDRNGRNDLRRSAASDGSAPGSSPPEGPGSPSSPSKTVVKVTKVKAKAMKVEPVHPELPNTPDSP